MDYEFFPTAEALSLPDSHNRDDGYDTSLPPEAIGLPDGPARNDDFDTYLPPEALGLPDSRYHDDGFDTSLPAEALGLPDSHDCDVFADPGATPAASEAAPLRYCPNCGKEEVHAKGLCKQCYKAKWYRDKVAKTPPNPSKKPLGRPPVAMECTACGSEDVYARGLCNTCYKRGRYQGNVTPEKAEAPYLKPRTTDPVTGEKKTCSYCGLRPMYAHGLCRGCHARARRNGGDPAYKSRSGVRAMKCRQKLKARHEQQHDKTKSGTGGAL